MYADTLGHDWEAEDAIGRYSDWNIARLRRAADFCYAMAKKINYAGTCAVLSEWAVAFKACEEANELRTAAFDELDSWQVDFAERLPELEENVLGPISNIKFCVERNETVPDDVRHHGGDPEEWDRFLHQIGAALEALADNIVEESER